MFTMNFLYNFWVGRTYKEKLLNLIVKYHPRLWNMKTSIKPWEDDALNLKKKNSWRCVGQRDAKNVWNIHRALNFLALIERHGYQTHPIAVTWSHEGYCTGTLELMNRRRVLWDGMLPSLLHSEIRWNKIYLYSRSFRMEFRSTLKNVYDTKTIREVVRCFSIMHMVRHNSMNEIMNYWQFYILRTNIIIIHFSLFGNIWQKSREYKFSMMKKSCELYKIWCRGTQNTDESYFIAFHGGRESVISRLRLGNLNLELNYNRIE